MLSILEKDLLDRYETARGALERASNRLPDDLSIDAWAARIAGPLIDYRDAERDLIDHIAAEGDIELPSRTYTVGWVAGRMRLRVVETFRPEPRYWKEEPSHAA